MIFSTSQISHCQDGELSDYFYPWTTFTYVCTPDSQSGNSYITRSYNMSKRNTLTQKTDVWQGLQSAPMSETLYYVRKSNYPIRKAIVSYSQIEVNPFIGKQMYKDRILMFVLPDKDGKEVSWEESRKGEKYSCTARFAYVSFYYEKQKIYRKAVKMTRTTHLENGEKVVEWSYWVPKLSRLATFGRWGDDDKVSLLEFSLMLDPDSTIEEVTIHEYIQNK